MTPPINPPNAFAISRADMLTVAASSGAALPYFMTRICIGGTLAKDAMPKTKAAVRNGHLNGATKPATGIDTLTLRAGRDAATLRNADNLRRPPRLPGRCDPARGLALPALYLELPRRR